MKAVILAGGLGTRISEESHLRPKPMIEIGGKPILWHIMKIYAHQGINDFIICLGYKGYIIKEYFANYILHSSDLIVDTKTGEITYLSSNADPWRITLIDTGADTMTGGRLKRVAPLLTETFCMTYGDGLANIDIKSEISFHKKHGRSATVAAVTPPGRYGALDLDLDGRVKKFTEKPAGDNGYINGGFFVLEPSVLDYINDDATAFEVQPLQKLAEKRQLVAYVHHGFWHAMDTLRDRNYLEAKWTEGDAPWKIW